MAEGGNRNYTPQERIRFYKFITSRNEWDTLRQFCNELGWDKNKIRQFNRIRAYWEGRSSQKRQGARTSYMDELINYYFEKVLKLDPMNVILDKAPPEAEYRATFSEPNEVLDYAEGTMFYEKPDKEGVYTSPFAYVEINSDGTLNVLAGDSNPKKKKENEGGDYGEESYYFGF
jgi:hypothetical protein